MAFVQGRGRINETNTIGAGAADPQTELPKPTIEGHWHACDGHMYVRVTAQITAAVNTDYAEFRVWTRDASGIGAPHTLLGGTGKFRATMAASAPDNDAVSETIHIIGASDYAVECTDRTDNAVRATVDTTLVNDPQV